MRFIKIRGAIRHSEIQKALDDMGLKEEWIEFMLGKTMCVINESIDVNKLSNQGVYPVDLERFCRARLIPCEITGA